MGPEGALEQVTTPDGTGDAVNAADGTRLVRRTPTSTTLYLGGDELTLQHGTGQLTGTRYYQLGGAILVVRTAAGTVSSLATDHQRTPLAAIDQDNHLTRRWQDPYGNPRGPQPAGWPGDRGFHTGTEDAFSGLVHLGARPYDPELGQFLSVDPLLRPGDSQQINGYSYANHNPLLLTDPSGLFGLPPPPTFMANKSRPLSQVLAERRSRGCGSCGGNDGGGQASSGNSKGGGTTGDRLRGQTSGSVVQPQPKPPANVRTALLATLQKFALSSRHIPVCTATVPDPGGRCVKAREALARAEALLMVNGVCNGDALSRAICAITPAPDYLTIGASKSIKLRFGAANVDGTLTMTRTGRLTARGSAGVTWSRSRGGPGGAAIDVKAGWLFDGTRARRTSRSTSSPPPGRGWGAAP